MIVTNSKEKVSQFCYWLGIYFLLLIVSGMGLGGMGSIIRLLAAVPVVIWLKGKHRIVLTAQVKATGLFIVACFVTVYWSLSYSESITRVVSHIMFLTLLISASSYTYTKSEIAFLKRCLINSSRLSAAVLLGTGSYAEGRLLLSGLIKEDPNYLCAYFMFGIAACILRILDKDVQRKGKFYAVAELIIYIYIIFSTGSRGGLFAIAVVVMTIILLDGGISSNIERKLLILALMAVAIAFVTMLLPENVVNRFTREAIVESNGTGRYDLWESAWETFKKSGFFREMFGYGTAAARAIIRRFSSLPNSVYHNVFVDNLVEIGIVGLTCYLIHIGSFVVLAWKKKDIFSISIILGMIVLSFSTSIYTFKPYWNIMLFIACCTDRGKNESSYCS